jgi:hypothetical protein
LLHHFGNHPDAGVAALNVGNEKQATAGRLGGLDRHASLVGLERHGEDHSGQNHTGLEGEQRQCHVCFGHDLYLSGAINSSD